ncbi:MAG TPA: hypothetical protein DEG71_11675, partial [Clostridiales bacterium]|nr:hypothetical protein [Clostridiales bacterium]
MEISDEKLESIYAERVGDNTNFLTILAKQINKELLKNGLQEIPNLSEKVVKLYSESSSEKLRKSGKIYKLGLELIEIIAEKEGYLGSSEVLENVIFQKNNMFSNNEDERNIWLKEDSDYEKYFSCTGRPAFVDKDSIRKAYESDIPEKGARWWSEAIILNGIESISIGDEIRARYTELVTLGEVESGVHKLFEVNLVSAIREELINNRDRYYSWESPVCLKTDYSPEGILSACAQHSKIGRHSLPI